MVNMSVTFLRIKAVLIFIGNILFQTLVFLLRWIWLLICFLFGAIREPHDETKALETDLRAKSKCSHKVSDDNSKFKEKTDNEMPIFNSNKILEKSPTDAPQNKSSKTTILTLSPSPSEFNQKRLNHKHGDEISNLNISKSDDGTWACEFCTFMNESSNRICEICYKTQILPPPVQTTLRKTPTKLTNRNKKEKSDSFSQNNILMDEGPEQQRIAIEIATTSQLETPSNRHTFIENRKEHTQHNTSTINSTVNSLKHLLGDSASENTEKIRSVAERLEIFKAAANSSTSSSAVNSTNSCVKHKITEYNQHIYENINPVPQFKEPKNLVDSNEHNIAGSSQQVENNMASLPMEAAKYGFCVEELNISISQYRHEDPIEWLIKRWPTKIAHVRQRANAKLNNTGDANNVDNDIVTLIQAKSALINQNGDSFKAINECVEQNLRKAL